MQKRDEGKDKASQTSVSPPPKETTTCRDHRCRQGQETTPPIAGDQHKSGPNPTKEDSTLELRQKAIRNMHHEQWRLGLIDAVQRGQAQLSLPKLSG